MESTDQIQTKEEKYNSHVLKAQSLSGSEREYCKKNDLNPATFYYFKKKLGLTKTIKSKFVKIEQAVSPGQVLSPTPNDIEFPNPEWLARFLRSYAKPS